MKEQNYKSKVKVSEKLAQKAKNFNHEKEKASLLEKEGDSEGDQPQPLEGKKDEKDRCIERLEKKLKQAETNSLYLRAEFENFKKHALKEKYSLLRYEGEKFISSLATEVLDDLDRALSASKQDKSLENLQKGLEMIHKKTDKLLSRFGIEILDPTGKLFDPSYQEALSFTKSTHLPEDHVVETYKKAYKLHDKVIRPAQVILSKKK